TKGAVLGTPHYISPEQCSGQSVDARSDIYSLGAMLYQMLSGGPPFDGPSAIIVMLKQLNEKAEPLYKVNPELHPLLSSVVMHALEKDPRSRPQTVTSFAEELSAAVRTATDKEFQDIFRDASEKELDASLLISDAGRRPKTGEYIRPRLISGEAADAFSYRRVYGRLSWFDLASIVYLLSGLKETGMLTLHNLDLAPGADDQIEMTTPYACIYFATARITP